MKYFVLVLSLLAGLIICVSSRDCSKIVKEHSAGVLDWLADVKFTVPVSTDSNGWTILLTFDQQFTGLGVWVVWVEYESSEKWARIWNRDNNAVLTAGQDFDFRFRVNYFTNVTKPQVTSMTFQGIELCEAI